MNIVRSIRAIVECFNEVEVIYLRTDMIKDSDIDVFATFVTPESPQFVSNQNL